MSDIIYLIDSSSAGSDVVNLNKRIEGYDYSTQDFKIYGNGSVNTIVAAEGGTTDASVLLAGQDVIVFSGSWGDYTKSVASAGVIVFTREVLVGTETVTETVTVGNGQISLTNEMLVFADGSVLSKNARSALLSDLASDTESLTDWSTALNSTALETVLPSDPDAVVNAIAQNSSGVAFAPSTTGVDLNAVGGGGVDRVYVTAGSTVDASLLLNGQDIIYFTGNWADYTKDTSKSGVIIFTREIDGNLETVTVGNGQISLTRDLLVFADGAIVSNYARTAINDGITDTTQITNWDPETITPGLGWAPASLTILNTLSQSVDAVYGDGTYNFQIALSPDDMDVTTTEISAWLDLANGSRPLATFNINGTEVTAELSSTDGYNLIFAVTLPSDIADGTAITLVSIDPRDVTDMTVNGQAIKDTLEISASGVTVDNGAPEFTSNGIISVAENSSGVVATVTSTDTVGVTYSLSGTDSSLFMINNNGQISVVDGTDLDYEGNQNSYSVTVTATDEFGNSAEQAVTVNLTNVNEAPTVSIIDTLTAVNGVEYSANVASYFTDVDADDSLTYTASGLPDGLVISSEGIISGTAIVATDAPISITITATDRGGLNVSQTVDLTVLNSLSMSTNIDGVTNLDVRSDVVITASEDVSLTTTDGVYMITLEDLDSSAGYGLDASSPVDNTQRLEVTVSGGTVTGITWYEDQASYDNNIGVTISDISSVLSVSGSTITINPYDDFDLASNYTVTVDDGLFVGDTSGTSASLTASFSTVTPTSNGGDSSGAAASQIMSSDGSVVASSSWLDLTDVGSFLTTTVTTDASAGSIVYVLQDSSSAAGDADNDGVIVSGNASVTIENFNTDDLLYIDNLTNTVDNNMQASTFGSGDGSSGSPLNWTQSATGSPYSTAEVNIVLDSSLGAVVGDTDLASVVDYHNFDNGMVISA